MPREDSDEEVYGPALPPKMKETKAQIGPALPPSLQLTQQSEEEEENGLFGPALPPHLLKRKREEEEESKTEKPTISTENKNFDDEGDDDDEIFGPLPAGSSPANNFAQQKLEERAWRLRNEFSKKNDSVEEKKREEWMTELPPAHSAASFGLGPRKFKTREGPDMSDRSCWTDTPADREKKRMERLNNASYEKPRKDKKKDKEREKDRERKKSKKNEKSLLEIHQEKMRQEQKRKEKEAKESGRTLRRPFDRDIDLKVGGLSEKDKKSIFAKSQLLDDRFCHSKS